MSSSAKFSLADIVLVIDHRENQIYPHLPIEATEINYVKKQLTVGDYALVNNKTQQILAVFERKTLNDFGASFKDGRYLNKEKMIQIRKETGCRLFYIIEGCAFPQPQQTFARIPYNRIEGAITHLMMRDNIMIIQTQNTHHTVVKLVRFIKSTLELLNKPDNELVIKSDYSTLIPSEESTDTDSPQCSKDGGTESKINPVDDKEFLKSLDVFDSLTRNVKRSDIDVVRTMWAAFKGLSVVSADALITKISIMDVVRGNITEQQIRSLKTASGRSLTKTVINSLIKMSKGDPVVEKNLLSRIPGISLNTAKEILETRTLKFLLSLEEGVISIVKVGKSQRNLGMKKAAAIIKYFSFKVDLTESLPAVDETLKTDCAKESLADI